MPIYSYKCNSCGHYEERQEPISVVDDALPACPKCTSSMLRVIHSALVKGFGKKESANHLPVELGGEWQGGHKVKRRIYSFPKEA